MRGLRALTATAIAAAVAGVSTFGPAVPAQAADLGPVAVWAMNEPADAPVMLDASGNRLHGSIGREVRTGVKVSGAKAYRFARWEPNTPPTHPEHLVTVPDNALLNPGVRDFAVTVRLRTTGKFGNIIQKGQATVPGGNFKFQIPNGIVQCLFRGSAGTIEISSTRRLNDGRWHTVRCERTSTRVTMTVDGKVLAWRNGATGRIANSWPLSIAGKTNCDQIKVSCDYYPGDIDRVQIDAS